MIVVDTNIVCYRWMSSAQSHAAEKALARDPAWIAPLLWRSEFRNVLAGALRRAVIKPQQALALMERAETSFLGREFLVSSANVLALIDRSGCSAYDCEFVALAQEKNIPLLTMDRQILREFPKIAVSLPDFLRA